MITNATQYLDIQNEKRKNKIAVEDDKEKISFGELYLFANKIADKIHQLKKNIFNKPIVVFCNKGVVEYLTLIGILYSGNFYVPLDVKMPKERLKLILGLVKPEIVITTSEYIEILDEMNCSGQKLVVDNVKSLENDTCSYNDWRTHIIDTDPAYMLFTSGSTGMPKGVVISHRAIVDYMEWQCVNLKFDDTMILANQAPFYFDASMPDIYTPLVSGATLVILPEVLFLFPNKLIELLNEKHVNTLIWVPSALMTMTNKEYFAMQLIKNLRLVMFCGEVMPNKHLNTWRRYYPDVKFINLYGPTEATYACTYYEINREFSDMQSLPIGNACGNTTILVLNKENELVEEGEEGELCIRGTCLANGYYGNPEKTKEVFVQNPLNNVYNEIIYRTGDVVRYNEYGELEYIGRKDFQIKHMGYRIELGEIETAAYGIPQMKLCCAIYDTGKSRIILYCVLEEQITDKVIYSFLKDRIPKYMLPSEINIVESLPLNANGKIDRKYLQNKIRGESGTLCGN